MVNIKHRTVHFIKNTGRNRATIISYVFCDENHRNHCRLENITVTMARCFACPLRRTRAMAVNENSSDVQGYCSGTLVPSAAERGVPNRNFMGPNLHKKSTIGKSGGWMIVAKALINLY